ncbi:MAG: YmfL family putative regulatory protein [Neisseria sp.]|nr:YmfL family putative regulatory protein [Neisseria sp.]
MTIKTALCALAKAPNGGHDTMAAMLGYSKSALQNRIYGVKGQHLSIEEALLMQRLTERTDFAEAVARESGGVFVKLPQDVFCAELADEEISACFIRLMAGSGGLAEEWQEAVEDGHVTPSEMSVLRHFFAQIAQEAAAVIQLTERFYGEKA